MAGPSLDTSSMSPESSELRRCSRPWNVSAQRFLRGAAIPDPKERLLSDPYR